MKFPNAQAGVSKLWTAQVLLIIAMICALIVYITASASAGLTGVLGIAMVIILIVAYIMEVVGLNQARKDDSNFQNALIVTILALILSVASGFFQSNGTVYSVIDMLARVANLCATVLTILGIRSVAEKLSDNILVDQTRRQMTLIIIPYLIGIVVSFIAAFMGQGTAAGVGIVILGLVGTVVEIIAFVFYMQLLSRAKKSFMA